MSSDPCPAASEPTAPVATATDPTPAQANETDESDDQPGTGQPTSPQATGQAGTRAADSAAMLVPGARVRSSSRPSVLTPFDLLSTEGSTLPPARDMTEASSVPTDVPAVDPPAPLAPSAAPSHVETAPAAPAIVDTAHSSALSSVDDSRPPGASASTGGADAMYFGLSQIVEAASSSSAAAAATSTVANPRASSPRRLREPPGYSGSNGDGTHHHHPIRLPDYSHLPKFRDSVQRMKIRVKLACSNCKASKTKCDDERPCRRCARTDRAATCSDSVIETMEEEDEPVREPPPPTVHQKRHVSSHEHAQPRAAAAIYQSSKGPSVAMVTPQQQQQQQQQQSMMPQGYMMPKMPLMPPLGAFPGMTFNPPGMWHHPQQSQQSQHQQQPSPYQPQGNMMPGMVAPINSMLKPMAPINHALPPNLSGLQRPDISTLQSCLHLTASQPPHHHTFQQIAQPQMMQMIMPQPQQQNPAAQAAGGASNNNSNANPNPMLNLPSPSTTTSTLSLSSVVKHPVSTAGPGPGPAVQQNGFTSSLTTSSSSTFSVPVKHVHLLLDVPDDRPTKKIKSEDGTPTAVVANGTDAKPPSGNGIDGGVAKEEAKPSSCSSDNQPVTPLSKAPTASFGSPLTASGRAYLEALVTIGLPHLHTWIARIQSESDAASANTHSNNGGSDTTAAAEVAERLALQMKRIDWLRSFFRFMHGNARSNCNSSNSGSENSKDVLSHASPSRSTTLPKSLYTGLTLGVLILPLGTEETTDGDAAPWVNESLAQLLGYQQSSQLEQLLCSLDGLASLHHPSNLVTVLPQFIDAVLGGVQSYATKSKWKHAQGHWIEVLESLNLTYHPTEGHVEYVASLMQVIANPASAPGPTGVQAPATYNPSVMLSMVQAGLANGMSLQSMSQSHSSYMPSLPISGGMMSQPTFSQQGFPYPQMMGYPSMQPNQPSPYGPMGNGMSFNVPPPSYNSPFGYPPQHTQPQQQQPQQQPSA